VTLIDYESAEYRHVAWDVAYLVVPWPSCWCSWRMPEEAAAAALARYRERAAPALPRVATPAFDGDLAVAVAGWAFVSAGWFLPNAFTDPPPSDPRIVTPSRRAVLQHRFALAAGMGDPVPASVTALAAECAAAIAAQWGDTPLALAPAWGAAAPAGPRTVR
jgi:hypothetical protein